MFYKGMRYIVDSKALLFTCVVIGFSLVINSSIGIAATIYVDNRLSADIRNGTYAISTRSGGGTDGNAFRKVQDAINSMQPGDTILIRGGTYSEGTITIPPSKNGTSWQEGAYNTLASYPGEWAIIDGNHNCEKHGMVLGYTTYDHIDVSDLKYWKFERLEVKNGSTPSGSEAAGFFVDGGPFIFRYCYIHDNVATSYGANPAGLKGQHWHDSVVEYCYLENNGMEDAQSSNAANILIYSDYNQADNLENGFDPDDPTVPVARNIFRYNLIVGSGSGFRHKTAQFFTGRNPAGGHGLKDTYKNYGDDIHHNIFKGAKYYGIGAHQDFCQVHNNIIDSCSAGIKIQYEPRHALYKVVTYNNTIYGDGREGYTTNEMIIRYNDESLSYEPSEYYGYDYNNIFYQGRPANNYCRTTILNIAPCAHSTGMSNYFSSNNYFYDVTSSSIITIDRQHYTADEFRNQTVTGGSKIVYSTGYDSSNKLFLGTTGADRYKVNPSHSLGGNTTILNGGADIPHPYLVNVHIPSYIGAVDPNDAEWVDIVLGLADIHNLQNGGGGEVNRPSRPSDFRHTE